MMLTIKEGVEVEIKCEDTFCNCNNEYCCFLKKDEHEFWYSIKCDLFDKKIIFRVSEDYKKPIRCEECISFEKMQIMKEILK